MYVSARLDYGLRVLVMLARQPDLPVSATRLAEHLGVSVPYLLAAILNGLRHGDLVVREGGRQAGCRLARPAVDITVADVVSALHIRPVEVRGSGRPIDEVGTRLAAVWQRLDSATNDLLASVSLADVAHGSVHLGIGKMGDRQESGPPRAPGSLAD